MTTIAKQAAAGQYVTPQKALRVLARTNHRLLTNPRMVNAVMHKAQAMDGRAHRIAGLPPGTGHGPSSGGVPSIGGAPGIAGRMRFSGGCPHCGATTIDTRRHGCRPVIIVR